MLGEMDLGAELDRVATAAAAGFADPDETLAAVVVAEPSPGRRTYLCAFDGPRARTWLALDESAQPVTNRDLVRESVAIAAACEVAEETTGGGDAPRVASPDYLDRLGAASAPALAAGLGAAVGIADELAREVEAQYKLPLT
jgi:hypothetical protein